ncbi:hypothetical protein HKX48_002830, partial [Thoreauomyces humboldtii]
MTLAELKRICQIVDNVNNHERSSVYKRTPYQAYHGRTDHQWGTNDLLTPLFEEHVMTDSEKVAMYDDMVRLIAIKKEYDVKRSIRNLENKRGLPLTPLAKGERVLVAHFNPRKRRHVAAWGKGGAPKGHPGLRWAGLAEIVKVHPPTSNARASQPSFEIRWVMQPTIAARSIGQIEKRRYLPRHLVRPPESLDLDAVRDLINDEADPMEILDVQYAFAKRFWLDNASEPVKDAKQQHIFEVLVVLAGCPPEAAIWVATTHISDQIAEVWESLPDLSECTDKSVNELLEVLAPGKAKAPKFEAGLEALRPESIHIPPCYDIKLEADEPVPEDPFTSSFHPEVLTPPPTLPLPPPASKRSHEMTQSKALDAPRHMVRPLIPSPKKGKAKVTKPRQ